MAKPAVVDDYFKTTRKVNHLIRSRSDSMTIAHQKGLEAALGVLKTNKPDATLADIEGSHLQTEEFQDVYINGVIEHLVAEAKDKLIQKKDHKLKDTIDDRIMNDQLLKTYTGLTHESLRDIYKSFLKSINGDPSQFTMGNFHTAVSQSEEYQNVDKALQATAARVIKKDHVDDILKYMKIHDKVHADIVPPQAITPLLGVYQRNGDFTDDSLYNILSQLGAGHLMKGHEKRDNIIKANFKEAGKLYKKAA